MQVLFYYKQRQKASVFVKFPFLGNLFFFLSFCFSFLYFFLLFLFAHFSLSLITEVLLFQKTFFFARFIFNVLLPQKFFLSYSITNSSFLSTTFFFFPSYCFMLGTHFKSAIGIAIFLVLWDNYKRYKERCLPWMIKSLLH